MQVITKRLLLVITLLLAVETANAQLNASWGETIDWINSKLKKHGDFHADEYSSSYLNIDMFGSAKYEVLIKDSAEYYGKYNFNLADLKSVTKCDKDNCIMLIFTGNAVNMKEKRVNETVRVKIKSVKIELADSDTAERLANAFSHLIAMVGGRSKSDETF